MKDEIDLQRRDGIQKLEQAISQIQRLSEQLKKFEGVERECLRQSQVIEKNLEENQLLKVRNENIEGLLHANQELVQEKEEVKEMTNYKLIL